MRWYLGILPSARKAGRSRLVRVYREIFLTPFRLLIARRM